LLQEQVVDCRQALKKLKAKFSEESKKPANGKAFGQPIHDAIDSILKEQFGCNRGVAHGGDFQGDAIRTIMGRRTEVFSQLKTKLLAVDSAAKKFPDNRIVELCDTYELVLGHLDAIFSIARTKRFHLTTQMTNKCSAHIKELVFYWDRVKLSKTCKLHGLDRHLVPTMSRIGGFGDLGEDSGERGIQSGRINDVRSKSLKSISKKAQAHARWETASMREDVRRQQQVVVDAARRIFQNCDRESSQLQLAKKTERPAEHLIETHCWRLLDRQATMKQFASQNSG